MNILCRIGKTLQVNVDCILYVTVIAITISLSLLPCLSGFVRGVNKSNSGEYQENLRLKLDLELDKLE